MHNINVPKDLTQAELFGVSELDKVKPDKHGNGLLPDPFPSGGFLVFSKDGWRHTLEDSFNRFIKKCEASGVYEHPVASPLPWHVDWTSAEIPVVYDANNVEVFRFGDNDQDDRDWTNAVLIIACVNKFASTLSPDDIERMKDATVA